MKSKALDHLGLISGMWDKLELGLAIDQVIPQDIDQRNISLGTACKALVINGLGFTQRTLYMVSSFFENKPLDILLGEGITSDHLNDTVLGRALDQIHGYGCTNLFSQLTPVVCKKLGLTCRFAHMDSTDFHLDGVYNSEHPPPEQAKVLHLTKGYSRDHRPDLNQVVLNLITENRSGIPIHMEALDGNSNDKTSFRQTITDHIDQLQTTTCFDYLVMDSAGYTEQGIRERSQGVKWISRPPESIKEVKELINSEVNWTKFDEKHKYSPFSSFYGGVEQRWLLVFSKEAYQRERKTLVKNYHKASEKEHKLFMKLCKKEFECEQDTRKAMEEFCKKAKYLHFERIDVQQIPKYTAKGRPQNNVKPSKLVYKIKANAYCDIAYFQQEANKKGKFIIATNELDASELSDLEVLKGYKGQARVERGFRFLKDPQFIASSLFVKKPERVEALLFIMTLCLTVYAALEHQIRQALVEKDETLPNQIGKQVQNPTARWVFTLFNGIHALYTLDDVIVLNIKKIHVKILDLMGKEYHKYYFLE